MSFAIEPCLQSKRKHPKKNDRIEKWRCEKANWYKITHISIHIYIYTTQDRKLSNWTQFERERERKTHILNEEKTTKHTHTRWKQTILELNQERKWGRERDREIEKKPKTHVWWIKKNWWHACKIRNPKHYDKSQSKSHTHTLLIIILAACILSISISVFPNQNVQCTIQKFTFDSEFDSLDRCDADTMQTIAHRHPAPFFATVTSFFFSSKQNVYLLH